MSADAQLASYVDRVIRLKEEADNIAGDVREVYAEAKANGYDKTQLGNLVTYLRKRAKDDDIAEKEAIFETYLTAYMRAKGEIGTRVATHAHAPEPLLTKAAGQGQVGSQAADSGDKSNGSALSLPDEEAAPTIQPETANETSGENGHVAADAAGHGQVDADAETQPTGGENVATVSAHIAAEEGALNASAAPLSKAERLKQLRPHCQFPERCGSSGGKNHCWPCRKAAGVAA